MLSLSDVRWCVDEVVRQEDDAASVTGMAEALVTLREACGYYRKASIEIDSAINVDSVERLGLLICPEKNSSGIRRTPVLIGYEEVPSPARHTLAALLTSANQCRLTPDEAYEAFENMHPFRDGNGRIGALLWNAWRGTLSNPVTPPDFWRWLCECGQKNAIRTFRCERCSAPCPLPEQTEQTQWAQTLARWEAEDA